MGKKLLALLLTVTLVMTAFPFSAANAVAVVSSDTAALKPVIAQQIEDFAASIAVENADELKMRTMRPWNSWCGMRCFCGATR